MLSPELMLRREAWKVAKSTRTPPFERLLLDWAISFLLLGVGLLVPTIKVSRQPADEADQEARVLWTWDAEEGPASAPRPARPLSRPHALAAGASTRFVLARTGYVLDTSVGDGAHGHTSEESEVRWIGSS